MTWAIYQRNSRATLVPSADVAPDIIPADRRISWKPGVTYNGGIPNRTTIFTTLSPVGGSSDDTSQINTALSNAAAVATKNSPQVVLLNAGQYNINGNGVVWPFVGSYVTLRGSGLPAAMATGGNLANDALSALNYVSGTWLIKADRQTNPSFEVITVGRGKDAVQDILSSTLLLSDAVKDSFSCSVTSVAGLSVGKLVVIDHNTDNDPNVFWGQRHDPAGADFLGTISGTVLTVTQMIRGTISTNTLLTGTGIVNPSTTTITSNGTGTGGTGTYNINNAQTISTSTFLTCGNPTRRFFCRQDRSASQMMEIASISGNTITFVTPFYYTFRVIYSAQLSIIDEANSPFFDGVSVENLGVFGGMGGDGHGNIAMGGCKNSWIKNVEAYWSIGTSIGLYSCYRSEVRDSFMHESPDPNPGGGGYLSGMNTWSSDCLFENCIMWQGNKEVVMRGTGGGNVVGYCYLDDAFGGTYPESPEAGVNAGHFTTPLMELLEGNYSQNYKGDSFWGNSIYITVFRSQLSGIRGCSPTGDAPNITPCNNLRNYTTNQAGTIFPYGDYLGRTMVDNQAHNFYTNFVGNILGFSGQTLLTYSSGTFNTAQTTFVYESLDSILDGAANVIIYQIGLQQNPSNNVWVSGSYVTQLRQGNWDWFTQTQKWHGIGGSVEYGSNPSSPFPVIPASLYAPGKPVFMYDNPWPWVDPFTGTTHTLPAKARFDAAKPNIQNWTRGQSASDFTNTTTTLTLASPVTSGDFLWGGVLLPAGVYLSSVTDDKGNKYFLVPGGDNNAGAGNGGDVVQAFYSDILTNGPQTLTFHATAVPAGFFFKWVDEVTPPTGATHVSLDGHTSFLNYTASAPTTMSGTASSVFPTLNNNDLMVAAVWQGGTIANGANWTSGMTGGVSNMFTYYNKIDAASANNSNTFTFSANSSNLYGVVFGIAPVARTNWVPVQVGYSPFNGANSTTITITMPSAVTPGNMLVGGFGATSTGLLSITDNLGGAYSALNNDAAEGHAIWWSGGLMTTSPQTFTITSTTNSPTVATLVEFAPPPSTTGVAAASVRSDYFTAPSITTLSTPSIVTTVPNTLVYTWSSSGAAQAEVPNSGLNMLSNWGSKNTDAYVIAASPGSFTPGWTFAASQGVIVFGAKFEPSL